MIGTVYSVDVTAEPRAEAYVPLAHTGMTVMTVHVRMRPGARPSIDRLRAEVAALDANLPLARVETVTEAVDGALAPTRFYLVLVGSFALLAVILAAVGLYGVVSYHVARRTREIGVRVALGARPQGIVRMVIAEGLRPALIGVAIGLAAATAASHVMESLLFQVQPRDPITLMAAPALLVSVVLLASLVPAWRATRIDPMRALREE